jgi:outer membrane protein OmpA-like peptidoglycan-associated protein
MMKTIAFIAALGAVQFVHAQDTTATLKAYQNFDFVAGNRLIFEDDFSSDQDGEFPAHWSLENGQAAVNKWQGKPTLLITDGNYGRVSPLMKTKSYLPDQFTMEFDTYLTPESYPVKVFFSDAAGTECLVFVANAESVYCSFTDSEQNTKDLSAKHPDGKNYDNYYNRWHHMAMIFKNKTVKIYIDERRALVAPNTGAVPASVQLGGIGSSENPLPVRNFRLYAGGDANDLSRMFTDGKYISHGIRFDVNKATIRPEAMGELNAIAKVLTSNPALKVEIGGHTDSDGDAAANLSLSERRADAVKAQLVALGIAATRLTTKGYGATKPVADNATFEGKAANRRVEFVKG